MTCTIDSARRAGRVAALSLVAALVLGGFAPAALAHDDHHGGDHRGGPHGDWHHGGWHHDGRHFGYGGGYYPAPPVVYGAPYYAPPPVVYGPGFGVNIHIP
jgi:hypothetical protein